MEDAANIQLNLPSKMIKENNNSRKGEQKQ